MGNYARVVAVLALLTVPSVAFAQLPPTVAVPPAAAQPTAAGQPPAPPAPPASAPEKPKGDPGGYTYSDKPAAGARPATPPRAAARSGGPVATLPGFEQTTDGGSRFFVQLTQSVPVEERKAQGSITYVLKGAHVKKANNTNPLVTVHFNTPVWRARLVPRGNDLLFVVDMRAVAAPAFKMQEGADHTALLTVDFAKGDFSIAAVSSTDAPPAAEGSTMDTTSATGEPRQTTRRPAKKAAQKP